MNSNDTVSRQRILTVGFALLILVVAFPGLASQSMHTQMTVSGQTEEEPKKKGETDGETSETSTTEDEDDEPDC